LCRNGGCRRQRASTWLLAPDLEIRIPFSRYTSRRHRRLEANGQVFSIHLRPRSAHSLRQQPGERLIGVGNSRAPRSAIFPVRIRRLILR